MSDIGGLDTVEETTEGPDDVVRASFLAICVRSPVYSLGLPQKKRATVPGPVWQPMVAPMG